MHTGRCHCEAVKYSFDGEVSDASCCHCSVCRRLTGSAFGAYGAIIASEFRWSSGAELVSVYELSASVTKTFCLRCGSPLTTIHSREPEIVFVSLGSLDDPRSVDLQYHQFTASQAPWHTIGDRLPKYDQWPPG